MHQDETISKKVNNKERCPPLLLLRIHETSQIPQTDHTTNLMLENRTKITGGLCYVLHTNPCCMPSGLTL